MASDDTESTKEHPRHLRTHEKIVIGVTIIETVYMLFLVGVVVRRIGGVYAGSAFCEGRRPSL